MADGPHPNSRGWLPPEISVLRPGDMVLLRSRRPIDERQALQLRERFHARTGILPAVVVDGDALGVTIVDDPGTPIFDQLVAEREARVRELQRQGTFNTACLAR